MQLSFSVTYDELTAATATADATQRSNASRSCDRAR